MGGTLAFTLRKEDGEEHRMSRWTNWMPEVIDNISLVNKDPAHIDFILKNWIDQRSLPESERHWAYHSPYLAPSEYGLVVVDLQKNFILDCNGYHSFGSVSGISLKLALMHSRKDKMQAFHKKEGEASRFYEFYKAGRIKQVQVVTGGRTQIIEEDVNKWPLEKIVSELVEVDHDFVDFKLDMSPFNLVTFAQGHRGYVLMKQAILELGFVLSAEEEQIWQQTLKDFEPV